MAFFETKERSKSDINVMNIYINIRAADRAKSIELELHREILVLFSNWIEA